VTTPRPAPVSMPVEAGRGSPFDVVR
jgi:hypothetical protein